jgi:hypothetical protein
MKYLKTFESYSINESDDKAILTPEVKSNIENKVKEEIAKLSPAQMEEVKDQLEDFAKKHGLSYDDLQDVDKLSKVLAPELEAADIPSNESWLSDKFASFKKWIGGFLVKLGLIGHASTIIGAATAVTITGEEAMKNPEVSGPIAIGILSAFAISTLLYAIGASIPGKGREIAQQLGRDAGRAMRS